LLSQKLIIDKIEDFQCTLTSCAVCHTLNWQNVLFSTLSKLAGRAIYFASVNFFLFSFFIFLISLLMIARRTIISGSAGPFFAIFSPNESDLGADDRSGPLFPISQGTLPWQPIS